MHALILAAALVAAPQTPGHAIREIVVGVCLPFAVSGEASADNIALAGLSPQPGADAHNLQTAQGYHLVRLTRTGEAADGSLRRVCEVQARTDDFSRARDAVAGPLERAGFTPAPDEPVDWPVWTRGGVTVTVHQNPGRATVIRVGYSVLDDDAA